MFPPPHYTLFSSLLPTDCFLLPGKFPSYFCLFFFFNFKSLNLVRIVGWEVIYWAICRLLHHWKIWFFFFLYLLTINSSSRNYGALMPFLYPWWNVDGSNLDVVTVTIAAVISWVQWSRDTVLQHPSLLPACTYIWPLFDDAARSPGESDIKVLCRLKSLSQFFVS